LSTVLRIPAKAAAERRVRWTALLSVERAQFFLWLPVLFAAAIGLYFSLPVEPPPFASVPFFAIAALLWAATWRRRWMHYPAIALTVLCCGFLVAQGRTALVAAPALERGLDPVMLEGEILALQPRAGVTRVVLHCLVIDGLPPDRTPQRVRIRLGAKMAEGVQPGRRVRLRVVLRPPPEPTAPGAFDFARQAYFERLGAVGFALSPPRPVSSEGQAGGPLSTQWRIFWEGARFAIAQRVRTVLGGETGALAVALMTGIKGELSAATTAAMRDSGLAHLLAISGLHMGLVAGWLFFAVRFVLALMPRIALFHPIKKWSAVVAVLGAFVYLFLAGATVPTQRAFFMVAMVFAAVLIDRRALTLRLVAWAALVVLMIAPESLLTASFQLSFAAVTALVAFFELMSRKSEWIERRQGLVANLFNYMTVVALVGLVATVATAPFIAYNFNRLALYGLFANMLAVPVMSLWIMPWALVGFLLLPFGIEALALYPMGLGIDLVLWWAEVIAGLPLAVVPVPAFSTSAVVAIAFGGLWIAIWRSRWRLLGLGPLLLGLGLALSPGLPDILISGDGRLAALRLEEGALAVSSQRIARFERKAWMRRLGSERSVLWPEGGSGISERMRCDGLGCLYRDGDQVIAFVFDGRALVEDCHAATVLISIEPVGRAACPGPQVIIDRWDLWREGAHAVYLTSDGLVVETVRAQRGRRPWVRWRGADR
jgi:competence protein ComEC